MATTPQEQEMFDNMLMQLAARHNGIEPLLKTIFSFFQRKTDLYVVANKEQNDMGFPPGIAEKIVMKAFHSLPMKDISKIQTKGKRVNPTSSEPRLIDLKPPSAPASSLKNLKISNSDKPKKQRASEETKNHTVRTWKMIR